MLSEQFGSLGLPGPCHCTAMGHSLASCVTDPDPGASSDTLHCGGSLLPLLGKSL